MPPFSNYTQDGNTLIATATNTIIADDEDDENEEDECLVSAKVERHVHFATTPPVVHEFEKVSRRERSMVWYTYHEQRDMFHSMILGRQQTAKGDNEISRMQGMVWAAFVVTFVLLAIGMDLRQRIMASTAVSDDTNNGFISIISEP